MIAGNTISAIIDGSLLPSTGFAKSDYTWNLWLRAGTTNDTIADFAPNATNVSISAAPEPATYALMLVGLGAIGFMQRQRRKRA